MTKGRLAVQLPITLTMGKYDPVSVLVGLPYSPPDGFQQAEREIRIGAEAVQRGPESVVYDPGVRFSWTVGTPWGLTTPLQNQLLEFEVPVEKQQGWSFVA